MRAKTFDDIANDNRAYVEAGLRAGKHEGVAKLLAHQYSTKTHFIFELLQNAEDAGATTAEFRVYGDRLEFSHDGTRLFTDRDVESITGIDDSNKDATAIGRHGIGFKSVFAYTHCPRIDSGDLHFELQDVFVPVKVQADKSTTAPTPKQTRITLPFDDETNPPARPFRALVPSTDATRSIDDALASLSPRTLLFLKKLKEIVWTTSDDRSGYLLQLTDEFEGRQDVRRIDLTNGSVEERWIVFANDLDIEVESDGTLQTRSFPVEVGYLIEDGKLIRAQNTELVVYFPTEKKTELGFLVQGPFSTTKARDNIISDDPNNQLIIRNASELAARSLVALRNAELIELKSYEALPLREGDFPSGSFFRPFFDAFKRQFLISELLPASDRGYVASTGAVLARGAGLRELISDEMLGTLAELPSNAKWISGEVTQDRTPELRSYVVKHLEVPELDPEAFARKLDARFLRARSDEWFISFYQFLDKQKSLWQPAQNRWSSAGPLRDKPILKLEDGELSAPFDKHGAPKVFLPSGESVGFKTVRSSIASDRIALSFLEGLGLKPVGEREIIKRVLETRYAEPDSINFETYFEDIKTFCGFACRISDARELFGPYRLFKSKDESWLRPTQVYLDEPFKFTLLHSYYGSLGQRARQPIATWQEADVEFLKVLTEFAERVQVPSTLWIFNGKCEDNPNRRFLVDEAIGNNTGTGIDQDFVIPDLSQAIEAKSQSFSKLVWDTLQLKGNLVWWEATFSKNQQKAPRVAPSQLCCLLKQEAWIPQVSGDEISFVKPAFATKDLLPPGFSFDLGWTWLQAIGFGESLNLPNPSDFLKQRGYSQTDIRKFELAEQLTEEDIEEAIRRKSSISDDKPTFPVRASVNPERRGRKLLEELADPIPKTYNLRQRSGLTSKPELDPREWLYRMYENDDSQVICQLCQREMPFRKRDHSYYFEAVELLDRDLLPNHRHEQMLALCPECEAKYKEYIKSDRAKMEVIRTAILGWPDDDEVQEDWQIEVELGRDSQIGPNLLLRFVEVHARALRTIISSEIENAEP